MLSGHFIFPPSFVAIDRREVERGRFTNEAIRRFQFQDSPNDFAASPPGGATNTGYGSDEVVGVEAVAPVLVKTTTFYGDGIHKQVGETLKIECIVDGVPPPNIIWYKVRKCIVVVVVNVAK